MKKLLLCLLAITAAISTAWAQTPKKNIFGLRVGMDMSKISILDTGSGEKYLSELRTSFNIGLTDQVRLLNDKPFYFQFGLMLHNKGGKVQATDGGSDIELSLNAMYLELPVMLNYHIRLAPKVAVIPFAGFFSKDEILTATMGHSTFWYIWMSLVAGLTAFYMFRLYYLIFWWKEHKTPAGHHAPHDQPWTMTLPLVILAVVSCFAGFVPMGNLVTWNGHEMFPEGANFLTNLKALNWSVAGISLAVAVAAIALATVMYKKENQLPAKFKNALPALWDWCYHRFYWDELYQFITHRIIFGLSLIHI